MPQKMLKFKGCQSFRQRLVFSTLSGRPIRIDDIRANDDSTGLKDFEASLLRLLEKLTNGCVVEINETGACLEGAPHHSTLTTAPPPLTMASCPPTLPKRPCALFPPFPLAPAPARHLTAVQAWRGCVWCRADS